jgi:hypothetical protein
LRWCWSNFAFDAYCLWHHRQPCGCVVTLPTVWENVGFGSPGISGTPPWCDDQNKSTLTLLVYKNTSIQVQGKLRWDFQ